LQEAPNLQNCFAKLRNQGNKIDKNILNFEKLLAPVSICDTVGPMSTSRRTRFSRRVPDHVTDELVSVLSRPDAFLFNELFEVVYENLKKRNAVSGGEEMLRLRAYEKLQNLVTRGLVEKNTKRYRGLDRIEEASSAHVAKLAAAASAASAKAAAEAAAEIEAAAAASTATNS
jgi:hypothetical protein